MHLLVNLYVVDNARYKNQNCDASTGKINHQAQVYRAEATKTNAAIWFNKICMSKQLTPKYINIKINGQNQQTQQTKAAVTKIRINQDIKDVIP